PQQVDIVHQYNGIVHHHTYQHNQTHQTLHVDGGIGQYQRWHNPNQCQRNGKHNNQGVQEALELGRHYHVNKHQRHNDGHTEVALRLDLFFVFTAHDNSEITGYGDMLNRGTYAFNCITQRYASFQVGIDINHPLPVNAFYGGRSADKVRYYQRRDRNNFTSSGGPYRNIFDILNIESIFRTQAHNDINLVTTFPEYRGVGTANTTLDRGTDLIDAYAQLS